MAEDGRDSRAGRNPDVVQPVPSFNVNRPWGSMTSKVSPALSTSLAKVENLPPGTFFDADLPSLLSRGAAQRVTAPNVFAFDRRSKGQVLA